MVRMLTEFTSEKQAKAWARRHPDRVEADRAWFLDRLKETPEVRAKLRLEVELKLFREAFCSAMGL